MRKTKEIPDCKISDIIKRLQALKAEHGDINCVIAENHDYWGPIYTYLDKHNFGFKEHTQPQGPKSGLAEKAIAFSYDGFMFN